jgi:hypothetical protein
MKYTQPEIELEAKEIAVKTTKGLKIVLSQVMSEINP